mmetsp:Transcript_14300/g.29661  ORF Transcript_14300/g.29661 Transcript_14300/m.29661 type:complete len:86 (-) Transcript_14300:2532-2789(-)
MLVALSSLASQQAKDTVATMQAARHFLDYACTHPDAIIRYQTSDMILRIHSNASYLSETKGRSRSDSHFYMGNPQAKPTSTTAQY